MRQKKWLIPDVLDPAEKICVQLEIPKDVKHIAAFWGALEQLSKAYNWEDSFVDGSTVAYLWRDIIEQASQDVREGVNCDMPIDCNEVELCIETSTYIGILWSTVLDMLSIQDGHEEQIEALTVRVADNELAIAANALAIIDLQNADIALQTQITNNFNSIAAHDITINQHSIAIGEILLRLNALESGGGDAGSNSQSERHDYTHNYATETTINTPAGVWKKLVNLSHIVDVKANNVMIAFEYPMDIKGIIGQVIQFRVGDGTQLVAMGQKQGTVTGVWDATLLHGFLVGVGAGAQDLDVEFTTNDGSSISLRGIVPHHITEIFNAPVEPLVTFDAGSYPWTLPSGQEGNILSGGNPDNCLKGLNLVVTEYISVRIDLGQDREIQDIIYDARSSDESPNSVMIWIDGGLAGGNSYIGATDNTWETFKQSDASALLPITGQVIVVQFNANASISDMRLDNIIIEL